ncbi:MAG: VWA domain-containing protein, partial [Thermoanaerobaculia bacterium]|nr:VWA domain-containing protein [Thermoanaerobaculia bacterium]
PAPGLAPAPEPSAQAQRPRRRLVIFFDRLQIPDPGQREELFESVRRLLEESIEPPDEAMIVTWDRSIRTVRPFTSDLEKLERDLGLIAEETRRMPSEKADLTQLQQDDAWFSSLAADPNIGSDFGGFTPTAEMFAQQAYFEMKAKTAAIKGLAATLGGMEGRKILVLVSHRFSRYAGLEFYLRSRTDAEALADPRTREYDTKKLLEDVTRTANAHGVTLYGLFPAGMATPSVNASDPRGDSPSANSPTLGGREQIALSNEMEALSFVADKTGGLVAAGPGAVPKFVDRVAADLDSWYSLGYPSPTGDGKAASVQVKVKGRKLTVRVRDSLIEKTLEDQMKDRVLAHLFNPDPRAKIPIDVAATLASTKKSEGFRIKVEIKVPIGRLALLPTQKGMAGAFSVFVASVGPKGDFSEVTRKSQPFEIPAAEVETASAGHYTYTLEIATSGPDARICVGVWDEKGNDAGFAVVRPAGPV